MDGYIQHVISNNKGISLPVRVTMKNIAFGAKASSSSDLDSVCKASYANDENNGTLWIGGTAPEEWLQLDFEKSVPIEKIEVYPEFPIYSYHYKIDISENGTDWKTVDDGRENNMIGSQITLQKKLNARCVRIKMVNNKNLPRRAIGEINVYY